MSPHVPLSALAAISLLAACCYGCGITTHMEVAYRALEFFKSKYDDTVDYKALILKHQDAFQASTSYPDTFYAGSCEKGKFHQVAEDTHWTPFIETAVRYIRDTYPRPWSEKAEKLVVFLLGIVSHDVADIPWHNLGLQNGFLAAMGKANFHGSYGEAHSHGDFGGDVINQVSTDTEHMAKLTTWHIPTDDLVKIYKRYYGDDRMSSSTINLCTKLMYLGRFGEDLGAINVMFPSKSKTSPFLLDRLQDYYLGGMDDMAAWTSFVWDQVTYMLNKGPDVCHRNRNPMMMTCTEPKQALSTMTRTSRSTHEPHGFHHPDTLEKVIGDLDPNDLEVIDVDGGVNIQANEKLTSRIRSSLSLTRQVSSMSTNLTTRDVTPYGIFSRSKKASTNIISHTAYSRLGESLVSGDFNHDGLPDMVIGAPTHSTMGDYMNGRVYIVYGTQQGFPGGDFNIDTKADVIIEAPHPNSRFGKALAVVDLNKDGVHDLVVSAPSTESRQRRYRGGVYVYYGTAAGQVATTPGLAIECYSQQCNLGWSLLGHDVNNDGFDDLIVGSPFMSSGSSYGETQRGHVGVLFASETRSGQTKLTDRNFDWSAIGTMDSSWFGFSLAAGGGYLAIGAPQHRHCALQSCSYNKGDLQAVGHVSLFKLPLTNQKAADRTIPGWVNFAQFGYGVGLSPDGNTLAVGAVSEDQGSLLGTNQEGRVYLYNLQGGSLDKPTVTLAGDSMLSRFGAKILFADVTNDGVPDILASAPLKGDAATQLWGGAQEGRVYIFHGKDNKKPAIGISGKKASSSDEMLKQGQGRSRFGSDFVVMKHAGKVAVAVSSLHSSSGARLAGKVSVFNF